MTISVLIVDDDPLVRAGLTLILGGAPDISVVGEAQNGSEAITAVNRDKPDVVLMDIRMPVTDGIVATEQICRANESPRVIVLTTFDADDYVVRALANGASGFLLKDTPPPDILAAIRKVHSGEPMLSPRVTEKLIRQVTDSAANGEDGSTRELVDRLTERERDVAIAIGGGSSNAEIATALHMSLATVKAHISHIFSKLETSNRVQVAICMHDAGLL